MSSKKWKVDGIPGFDEIIRWKGKLYKLWSSVDYEHIGRKEGRRKAVRKAGKEGKVFIVTNTFSYAIYIPYSGLERPPRRA